MVPLRGFAVGVLAVAVTAGAAFVGLGSPAGAAKGPAAVRPASSKGCGATPVVAAGETTQSLTSAAATYTYIRHVPPQYDGSKPLPLVIDFHGYSEPAAVQAQMSGFGAYGDAHGFITVTPEGPGVVPLWDTTLGGKDLVFVGHLLDHVEATLCVDTNRVFAAGLSNGAFMTSAVACAYANRIAAVAPVAGIRDIKGCKPARPVPVVAFHGTADPFVAYGGGYGPAVASLPAPDGSGKLGAAATTGSAAKGPSIPTITADWAKRNRCSKPPKPTKVAFDVTLIRYRCPKNATVELYRVAGGGHAWPGSEFSKVIASTIGKTTFSVSADDIIWKFFRDHPLQKS